MADKEDKLKKLKEKKKGGSSSSDSSKKKKKKKKKKSGESSSSGPVDAFSMDEDEMADPSAGEVSDLAQEWADDGAELNTGANKGESFSDYARRQKKEVRELHDNMIEMYDENARDLLEFTPYFNAMIMNFARNRAGIAETIQNNFDKSESEALELTHRICREAGEGEMIEKLIKKTTGKIKS